MSLKQTCPFVNMSIMSKYKQVVEDQPVIKMIYDQTVLEGQNMILYIENIRVETTCRKCRHDVGLLIVQLTLAFIIYVSTTLRCTVNS